MPDVVSDVGHPYDGKTTLGGLPYLGPGYGVVDGLESVMLLACAKTGDPVVWTTTELFNEQRETERAAVAPTGDMAWGGGWECPECGEFHAHDVTLATGSTVAELKRGETGSETESGGNHE